MTPRVRLALSSAVLLSLACVSNSNAAWLAGGSPVCTATARQDGITAAADDAGGAFISWNDLRSGTPAFYVQHLTHDGDVAPGWPVNGVLIVTPAGANARVCSDAHGGCYLAWGIDGHIRSQHVLPSGIIDPAWPAAGHEYPTQVSASTVKASLITAAGDKNGSLIVLIRDSFKACNEAFCTMNWTISMSRVNSAGVVTSAGLTSSTSTGNNVLSPDESGGAWYATGDDHHVTANHIGTAGGGIGSYVNNDFNVFMFDVQSASDGGAFASVVTFCGGGHTGFTLERVLPSGAVAPGWSVTPKAYCPPAGHSSEPHIISAGQKRPLVFWVDSDESGNRRFYATVLDSLGGVAPGWPAAGVTVCDLPGMRAITSVVADGSGGGLTAWQDPRNAPSYDIYATHVGGNGALAPGWTPNGTLVSTTSFGSDQAIPVVTDGSGGGIVVWLDDRDGPTSDVDIYAQRLNVDGPVPTELALASAEVHDGKVMLDWFAPDAAALQATVYRRTESSAWSPLGSATGDGTGHVRYEDASASLGARLGYRLGYREDGVEKYSAESWVDVPSAEFALQGLRPNPAIGRLAVSFSLMNSEPATIEMMDLGGRRMLRQEVGSLGAGRHVIELSGGSSIHPGVYWLRLHQGERTLLARGAVVR